MRAAIDIGGTFTDVEMLDENDGRLFEFKVPTTRPPILRPDLSLRAGDTIRIETSGDSDGPAGGARSGSNRRGYVNLQPAIDAYGTAAAGNGNNPHRRH